MTKAKRDLRRWRPPSVHDAEADEADCWYLSEDDVDALLNSLDVLWTDAEANSPPRRVAALILRVEAALTDYATEARGDRTPKPDEDDKRSPKARDVRFALSRLIAAATEQAEALATLDIRSRTALAEALDEAPTASTPADSRAPLRPASGRRRLTEDEAVWLAGERWLRAHAAAIARVQSAAETALAATPNDKTRHRSAHLDHLVQQLVNLFCRTAGGRALRMTAIHERREAVRTFVRIAVRAVDPSVPDDARIAATDAALRRAKFAGL